jgi:hypothetical protein
MKLKHFRPGIIGAYLLVIIFGVFYNTILKIIRLRALKKYKEQLKLKLKNKKPKLCDLEIIKKNFLDSKFTEAEIKYVSSIISLKGFQGLFYVLNGDFYDDDVLEKKGEDILEKLTK